MGETNASSNMVVQADGTLINPFVPLSEPEIQGMIAWKESIFEDNYSKMDRFKELFNDRNIGVTWRLWMISILNSLIGAGTVFLLPFLLDN